VDIAANNVVSVFGSNEPRAGEQAYRTARAVGRRLAELGFTVANGGYGGTMEASARGAKEADGQTIGVTCSVWRSRPNNYIDHIFATHTLSQRVETLIAMGKAGYVVLPGATGTLLELATVWEMIEKSLIPARPVVSVGRFWGPLVRTISSARPKGAGIITMVDTPDELGRFFRLPPAGLK